MSQWKKRPEDGVVELNSIRYPAVGAECTRGCGLFISSAFKLGRRRARGLCRYPYRYVPCQLVLPARIKHVGPLMDWLDGPILVGNLFQVRVVLLQQLAQKLFSVVLYLVQTALVFLGNFVCNNNV